MAFRIRWTQQAIENLESILDYLAKNWSQKETDNFKSKLRSQLKILLRNPKIFPVSEYNPRLRKAVLSKQTTIFYELKDDHIIIVYLFANKMDTTRLK